jgi:hypothetical protein
MVELITGHGRLQKADICFRLCISSEPVRGQGLFYFYPDTIPRTRYISTLALVTIFDMLGPGRDGWVPFDPSKSPGRDVYGYIDRDLSPSR